MILTHINDKNLSNIAKVHPLFDRAFAEIRRLIETDAPNGKYVVEGDDAFVNVMDYETKAEADSRFETHREYIDIQVVSDGVEIIGFADLEGLTVTEAYKPDIEFYGMVGQYDSVIMTKGKISIIFPGEPHAPAMAVGDAPVKVKKLVAKIRM